MKTVIRIELIYGPERMQVMMANYYLIHSAGNEEKLMEVVSRGKEEWGQQNKQWGLIEGLALKFTGKNKEGNAILRYIV